MAAPQGYYGAATTSRPLPAKKKKPKTPRRRGETVEQWLERQWREYSNQQIASVEEQRRLYEEEMNRQYQARIARGQALAQAIQGMGFDKAIQGTYSNAANDLAGLASGFAGSTRGIADAEAAAQRNMLSGTGQEGAVRNEGVSMGDVAYGVGGFIPGRALGETGAALAADAALQPAFTMQQSALDAEKMRQEDESGLLDFAKMLAEIKAGKYEFTQGLREQRSAAMEGEREYRFQLLKWQADQHYRNYMLALERGDQKRAEKEYQLAVRKQRQAELEAQRDYGLDVREQDWKESPSNPANKPEGKKKGGGFTPYQRQGFLTKVAEAEEDISKAVNAAMQKHIFNRIEDSVLNATNPGRRKAELKERKKDIVNMMMSRFGHLAPTPTAKRALKKLIQRLVNEAKPSAGSGSGGSYGDYR